MDDGGELFRRFGEVVEGERARLGLPGVAVGVLHGGAEYAAGFGATSARHPLDVDADTLFQIGSITKTVTAMAAMRLVEAGKLALDAPVRAYLPDLRLTDADAASGVTMRHLLGHTGGWVGDYFDDFGDGDDALARMVASLADLPQLTPLGEVFSYNNAGFYLAGRVIEAVAGQTYEAAIKALVLEPLGMRMSFFFPAEVMLHRFAVGHHVADGAATVMAPWPIPRAANAAGGLSSTVHDLFRYARFWLGDGTAADGARLLSPESVAQMRTPFAPIDSVGNAVGIGWMLRRAGDVRLVTHNGGTNGQVSHLAVVPERDFALIILTNALEGGELITEATRWAHREYLGVDAPEPAHLDRPAAELATYAGHYEAAGSHLDLTVREGGLLLQVTPQGGFPKKDSPAQPAPPPVPLAFVAPDRVVATEAPFKGAGGDFLRGPDGAIVWLRFGSRIARRIG